MGTIVLAPWEGSDIRSEDGFGPGADNTANVLFALGALNWSDTARAVGTVVSSWMAREIAGRITAGAGAMSSCRSNAGNKSGVICAAWEVETGDPFTATPRESGCSVPGVSASG